MLDSPVRKNLNQASRGASHRNTCSFPSLAAGVVENANEMKKGARNRRPTVKNAAAHLPAGDRRILFNCPMFLLLLHRNEILVSVLQLAPNVTTLNMT